MDVVTREDGKSLVERRGGPCVSIHLPTHRAVPDTRTDDRQDPVRLRNLLRETAQRLATGGVSARAVEGLLQPARRLLAGTRDYMSEVECPAPPRSLAQALRYDDPERQLQYHTGPPGGGDQRAAMFHGHGTGIDDAYQLASRYWQQIGRARVPPPSSPAPLA